MDEKDKTIGMLRAALLDLLESWKDLNRVCTECAFPDSDGIFSRVQQRADRAFKKANRALKKTEIRL